MRLFIDLIVFLPPYFEVLHVQTVYAHHLRKVTRKISGSSGTVGVRKAYNPPFQKGVSGDLPSGATI
jgi:hypothetical protein